MVKRAAAWVLAKSPHRAYRSRHGWVWRRLRHEHVPFHPSRYEFWYCARCRRALCRIGWEDPPRWVPFDPGLLWAGPVVHWTPDLAKTT